jgi:hypothetical protein
VAWVCLVLLAGVFGRTSRIGGLCAAAAAGLVFLWAHSHPRFAATVSDVATIRLSFLLGGVAAVAALITSRLAQDR